MIYYFITTSRLSGYKFRWEYSDLSSCEFARSNANEWCTVSNIYVDLVKNKPSLEIIYVGC